MGISPHLLRSLLATAMLAAAVVVVIPVVATPAAENASAADRCRGLPALDHDQCRRQTRLVFPTANDNRSPLLMHTGPRVRDRVVGRVPAGASVQIVCQAYGDRARDRRYGTTTLWDLVRYGSVQGYVTDLYVLTGRDRVGPLCR
jgi:hypothetical protein